MTNVARPARVRWLTLPLAGIVLGTLRCASQASAPAAMADAAIDSGLSNDASVRDATTKDAGFTEPDAGAGWKWFAAFGPSCTKYSVPLDPKRELPPITWQTCATPPYATGGGACVEWDWASMTKPYTASAGSASMSGDGRYLRISRLRESSKDLYDEEEDVYDRASLEPQMALRFRNFDGPVSGMMDDCYATLSADGFTTPFLVVSRPTFGGSISGNFSQLMNATGYDHLVPEFQPYPNAPIARSGSDTIQTFQDSVGQHVVRVDRKTHTWLRAKTGPNSQPLAVQDDVFVRDKSQPYYRLSRVEANGDVTVVRAFPSRHVINATYDGTYVYWVELSGGGQILGPQSHFELWRTKYTRDIASFNATAEQIAALDGTFNYGFSLVFDGVFVTATAQEALVIRISDHKVKQLPSAATVEAVPFYVDQSDVWVRYIVAKPGDVHYAKVSIDW